ncbi:MAG: N-acetyltransferase [Spirochaetes bacterium]|nr:N-acetyltransferase [Spirochaetota bacterium]
MAETGGAIRRAVAADARRLCEIYNHYVERTTVTFEEEPVPPDEMEGRIAGITSSLPWLLFEEGGRVLGYSYAGRWKDRSAYRFTAESTVYVDAGATGRGIGTALYRQLLDELRVMGINAVIGGIALPNEVSLRLHERLGFKRVARLPQVGYKFGRWIDVEYRLLLLRGSL